MAPLERFPSTNRSVRSKDEISGLELTDFDALSSVVKEVCSRHNLLHYDSGDVSQSCEQYEVFTVGNFEDNAYAVVLIGYEPLESVDIGAYGTRRPHKLIAPQEIIDEVKEELGKLKVHS